jgi:hypothetical protein
MTYRSHIVSIARAFAAGSALVIGIALRADAQPNEQRSQEADARLRAIAIRLTEWETRRQLSSASPATVDSMLALYSDSVVYEHPNAGAIVRGKPAIRRGMIDHIGSVRNVKADAPRVIVGHNVAIVETNATMEIADGNAWVPVTRRGIRVIEFDASGHVRRIIDYPW